MQNVDNRLIINIPYTSTYIYVNSRLMIFLKNQSNSRRSYTTKANSWYRNEFSLYYPTSFSHLQLYKRI